MGVDDWRGLFVYLVLCRGECSFSGWGGKIVLHVNLIYEYGVLGEMGLPAMSPFLGRSFVWARPCVSTSLLDESGM